MGDTIVSGVVAKLRSDIDEIDETIRDLLEQRAEGIVVIAEENVALLTNVKDAISVVRELSKHVAHGCAQPFARRFCADTQNHLDESAKLVIDASDANSEVYHKNVKELNNALSHLYKTMDETRGFMGALQDSH